MSFCMKCSFKVNHIITSQREKKKTQTVNKRKAVYLHWKGWQHFNKVFWFYTHAVDVVLAGQQVIFWKFYDINFSLDVIVIFNSLNQ